MSDKTKELLPCPFCGSKAEIRSERLPEPFSKTEFFVTCTNLGVCHGKHERTDTWGFTHSEDAVKLWNIRPPASRRHVYWGAGEPDCPRDIKAPNGELHTLRCKVCGLDNPKSFCFGEMALARCGKICATRNEYEEGRCSLEAGHVGGCYDANGHY